jgi:hypothetical protein
VTNGPVLDAGGAAGILRIARNSAVVAFSGAYAFAVTNVRGEIVISRNERGPALIDMQGLKPGIYIVRVRAAGRTYAGEFTPTL